MTPAIKVYLMAAKCGYSFDDERANSTRDFQALRSHMDRSGRKEGFIVSALAQIAIILGSLNLFGKNA